MTAITAKISAAEDTAIEDTIKFASAQKKDPAYGIFFARPYGDAFLYCVRN